MDEINYTKGEWNETFHSFLNSFGELVLRQRVPNSKRGFAIWRWKRHYSLPFDHSHYESWDSQMAGEWQLVEGVNPPFQSAQALAKAESK